MSPELGNGRQVQPVLEQAWVVEWRDFRIRFAMRVASTRAQRFRLQAALAASSTSSSRAMVVGFQSSTQAWTNRWNSIEVPE